MITAIPAPASWPEPVASRAVLTPRGHAAVAVIRLGYEIRELEGADRAAICSMLRDLLADVAA